MKYNERLSTYFRHRRTSQSIKPKSGHALGAGKIDHVRQVRHSRQARRVSKV